MCLSFLNGMVMAFDAPTRQAMVVELVGKNNLSNAIALNSVAFNSSRIIGPAIAGILIAAIGMSGCFFVNGASFFAVILALFLIKNDYQARKHKDSPIEELKQGLIFVRDHRNIALLIIMVGVISLFGTSYIILMPVFADNVLKTGVGGMGILMSAAGLGALFGALLLARLGDFNYKGRYLHAMCLVFSVSLVLFSLLHFYWVSLFLLAVIAGSAVTAIALINTILQTTLADGLRGRVMGVFMITFAGFTPFGNLISGALSQSIGVSAALFFSGVSCFVFFLFIPRRLREII